MELATRRDHVRATSEKAANIVEVARARHVQDAVSLEGDDLVDVLGHGHAGRADAAELAGIPPGLLGRVHVHAGQVQVRVVDDGP